MTIYGFVQSKIQLRPQTLTGALPLDPAVGLPSRDPLFCPPRPLANPDYTPDVTDGFLYYLRRRL